MINQEIVHLLYSTFFDLQKHDIANKLFDFMNCDITNRSKSSLIKLRLIKIARLSFLKYFSKNNNNDFNNKL